MIKKFVIALFVKVDCVSAHVGVNWFLKLFGLQKLWLADDFFKKTNKSHFFCLSYHIFSYLGRISMKAAMMHGEWIFWYTRLAQIKKGEVTQSNRKVGFFW